MIRTAKMLLFAHGTTARPRHGAPAAALVLALGCGPSSAPLNDDAPRPAASGTGSCPAGNASLACGDPCSEGVVIDADVTSNTVWDCPVYTLAAPVYVRGQLDDPTRLVVAPGTVIRGRAGDLDEGRLPGALIITRSGHLDARGTPAEPIVFTSARPPGERAPGDWGGVVLLGRAPTNVPADFEGSGNLAGEMFIEGLPRGENTTYGATVTDDAAALGDVADPNHDCGALRFVRIEFAGFEVGDTNELNGLTVGACGRGTVLDYVQVHLGADDGIEFFGGATDLQHAVITGSSDDALDWDQGWTGRVQFLAIRQFGTADGATESDSGFEGDGHADAEAALGEASAPVMYNVTLLSSDLSTRGIRLREGTRLSLNDAILASAPGGPREGLIEIGDAATADELTLQRTRINSSILQGTWPIRVQADTSGNSYLAEDYFTLGAGSANNTALGPEDVAMLLPDAFDAPDGWMPIRGSHASRDWVVPDDGGDLPAFFDASATYRGAFDPSGDDWTRGWTAFPAR
jgi:hypothetical protein